MQPDLIAHCSLSERDLYFLSIDKLASCPESISLSAKNFSVFLALDAAGLDIAEISGVANKLLRAGAVYICCWGSDCERVHGIFDEVELESFLHGDGSVIMITWHANDTLSDAVWFFVRNSFPDNKYFASCKAGLAISVSHPDWDDQIVAELRTLACQEK